MINSKSDIMTFSVLRDRSTDIYHDCQGKILPNGNNFQPSPFTIKSSTKFDFMHGKVECSLKTNLHKGNICVLDDASTSICWTDKLQKSAENRADYNVSIGRKNRILNQVQVKTQYRAFVLEWDPTKNSLFLDGKEVFNYHSLESIKQ